MSCGITINVKDLSIGYPGKHSVKKVLHTRFTRTHSSQAQLKAQHSSLSVNTLKDLQLSLSAELMLQLPLEYLVSSLRKQISMKSKAAL